MLSCNSVETLDDPGANRDDSKAAAWPSSARSVRSSLKWGNERNPRRLLNISNDTALEFSREEGEDDVRSARRLCRGPHTSYNGEKQWVATL